MKLFILAIACIAGLQMTSTIQARQWEVSGTTAPYTAFIQWSNVKDSPLNSSEISFMQDHLKTVLSSGESLMLENIVIVWEGTINKRTCSDVRQLAYTTINWQLNKAEIRLCLRTIMYLGDLHRALIYLSLPAFYANSPVDDIKLRRYLARLREVVEQDRSDESYKEFCTAEYVFFALNNGLKTSACDLQSAASKKAFQTWFTRGMGWKEGVLNEYRRSSDLKEKSTELMKEFYFQYFKGAQTAMIYSVVLHEIGHIANCDVGSVGTFICAGQSRSPGLSVTQESKESAADSWALTKLESAIILKEKQQYLEPKGNRFHDSDSDSDFDFDSMAWIMINRIFAALVYKDRTDQILERMTGQVDSYRKLRRGRINNLGDISPVLEKVAHDFSRNHSFK